MPVVEYQTRNFESSSLLEAYPTFLQTAIHCVYCEVSIVAVPLLKLRTLLSFRPQCTVFSASRAPLQYNRREVTQFTLCSRADNSPQMLAAVPSSEDAPRRLPKSAPRWLNETQNLSEMCLRHTQKLVANIGALVPFKPTDQTGCSVCGCKLIITADYAN